MKKIVDLYSFKILHDVIQDLIDDKKRLNITLDAVETELMKLKEETLYNKKPIKPIYKKTSNIIDLYPFEKLQQEIERQNKTIDYYHTYQDMLKSDISQLKNELNQYKSLANMKIIKNL
jgi:predicted  nucleic acid-binding Zn-ribbon protein